MSNVTKSCNQENWDELVVSSISRGYNKNDWGGMVGPGMEFNPPPISAHKRSKPRAIVIDPPPGARR